MTVPEVGCVRRGGVFIHLDCEDWIEAPCIDEAAGHAASSREEVNESVTTGLRHAAIVRSSPDALLAAHLQGKVRPSRPLVVGDSEATTCVGVHRLGSGAWVGVDRRAGMIR